MSTYNSVYGQMTILGDNIFDFDMTEHVLPIMNELGLVKTTVGEVWERKVGELFESMSKTEESWSFYDFIPWCLKYTDEKGGYDESLDCFDDVTKRVPLVPLPPTGSESDLGFVVNYDGCFVLSFCENLRDRDDRDVPYIRFWFETLAGILNSTILVKVTGCNTTDIIDIDCPSDEKRIEWVKRYFKFYLEWHNNHYLEYRKQYCMVVKEFRNKNEEAEKERRLKELNRTLVHWHDFVLGKLKEDEK